MDVAIASNGHYFDSTIIRVFKSVADVDDYIREFEEATDTKFVVCTKAKEFGSDEKPSRLAKNIFWESQKGGSIPIPFNGNPLMFYGRKVMGCHLGSDKNKSSKNKIRIEKEKLKASGDYAKKSRNITRESKKIGCRAKIFIQQILRFSSIKITDKGRYSKENGIKDLEDNFEEHVEKSEIEYYLKVPPMSDHQCFQVGHEEIGKREGVDERIKSKIIELTSEGANISTVKEVVEDFVINVLFFNKTPPPRTRRKYFPKQSDYFNLMRKSRKLQTEQRVIIETDDSLFNLQRTREVLVEDSLDKVKSLEEFIAKSSDIGELSRINSALQTLISTCVQPDDATNQPDLKRTKFNNSVKLFNALNS